jgi:phosphoribosylformylglycinamidine synthase
MASELDRARREVRVLVLTGLGLNCEAETAQGFRMCGASPDLVHLGDLLEGRGPRRIRDYHVLAMIGGFSFGDHVAAGVVYANRLRWRLREELDRFVEGGGLVLGICNGFQTMVKLGLVPGLDGDRGTQTATLAANDRLGYRDAWVRLRGEPASPCVWTRGVGEIELPARHGEGKFLAASPEVLERIESEHLVALRYVDESGRPTQQWPANPNGSPNAIAGVCDPSGRICGMMPHPDAFLYGFHHPQWQRQKLEGRLEREGEGVMIFRNGVDFVAAPACGDGRRDRVA